MEKDFDTWNGEKKRVNAARPKLYHARELWWCSLGLNVGFEQDGTGADFQRPVLILRGVSPNTCFVVPLTTSSKRHRLRVPIGYVEGKSAAAIVSQMRLIDARRLVNKIGFLDQRSFSFVRKAAKDLL
jgi:mRNA interferase MazF